MVANGPGDPFAPHRLTGRKRVDTLLGLWLKRVIMKRFLALTFIFAAAAGLTQVAWAGPEQYSGKEMKQVAAPPPCEWYSGHEWNVSLWGAFAFPENDGTNDPRDVAAAHEAREDDNHEDNVGPISHDQFLNRDQVWGGGADIKYFFCKYVGVGVEGYALQAHDTVGGALATLTLRYPIGCSRFAPYVFGGVGAAFNGTATVLSEDQFDEDIFTERDIDRDTVLEGEVGGGLEIRFTRHIGIMADFSWHFLDKPNNNFGMARSGITFNF
jgi:hypothetical protein